MQIVIGAQQSKMLREHIIGATVCSEDQGIVFPCLWSLHFKTAVGNIPAWSFQTLRFKESSLTLKTETKDRVPDCQVCIWEKLDPETEC